MLAAREGRVKLCRVVGRANILQQHGTIVASFNIYFVAHNIPTRISVRHDVLCLARKSTTEGRYYPAIDHLLLLSLLIVVIGVFGRQNCAELINSLGEVYHSASICS